MLNTLFVQNHSVKDDVYHDICSWVDQNTNRSLLLYDLNKVKQLYDDLKLMLPNVNPLFAVKSAPFPGLLSFLDTLGCGFEIASQGELTLLHRLGIDTSESIFTNPINSPELIEQCIQNGVKTFVVDNQFELTKYEQFKNQCQLIVRVAIRNNETKMDLSKKFGCNLEDAIDLLQAASDHGLCVKGLSFHVGSNVVSSERYVYALNACYELIHKQQNYNIQLLDIGGGFPVFSDDTAIRMADFFNPIRESLKKFETMNIVSEPGRFLSGPGGVLIVKVIGKNNKNGKWWYYLNEGVYGAFSGKIFDYASYPISVFGTGDERLFESVLAGPTCDSFDIIEENIALPELEIGDLLLVHNIGAYSFASTTEFNGMEKCEIMAVADQSNPIILYSQINSEEDFK